METTVKDMNSLGVENQAQIKAAAVGGAVYEFRDNWANLPAGRMHYVDEGAGETLLFVHGTPSWSYEWRHVVSALSPDFRCVVPDLIGFGMSERPLDFAYTPEAHAEVLQEFVHNLDLRDITLVVHDFGGPIGLPICLREPKRVKRLVIINTWMWSLKGDGDIERANFIVSNRFGRFLYEWANFSLRLLMPTAYADKRKLTKEIHQQYLDRFSDRRARGKVLWTLAKSLLGSTAFYESLWEQREKLKNRPALILWGMKDAAFKPHYLERWKEVLPDAQIVELENAGHWAHEEEPEKVIESLRSFMKKQ
jgi:haloalkane dehalogenase